MIVEGEDATVVAQKCTRLTDGAAFSRGRLQPAACTWYRSAFATAVPTSGGRPVVKFLVDCAMAHA